MFTDFDFTTLSGKTVAVALSGGSDSMALLYYMLSVKDKFQFNLVALNVEHGIRGEASLSDSEFVKEQCKQLNIPLLSFKVDALSFAKENKLSIEQSARILRYNCYKTAINAGNCHLIATAHHLKDNAETILLNLFRGTGLKGASGISNFDGSIIRPFIATPKEEILSYLNENAIPFVTDESNFVDDVTRNNLRLNVLPLIEKLYPDYQNSLYRFSLIAKEEDEYLDGIAKNHLFFDNDTVKIDTDIDKVIFKRACILAFKLMGIEKDWEKAHVDASVSLLNLQTGAKINLPKGVTAIKEYDKIVLYKLDLKKPLSLAFNEQEFSFYNKVYSIKKTDSIASLKNGFYLDVDKVAKTAVIRTKKDGDVFTKFGGGTKSLNDYFTDKKIPARLRDSIPIIADGNKVLAIFGIAISDLVKVDNSTKTIYQLS